jgi:hypothetical protein
VGRPSAQGVVNLADFGRDAHLGDGIAVRLATFHSRSGPCVRVLSATATDQVPGPEVRQASRDQVRVTNGMGFTDGSIFIPPHLVTAHQIEDGDFVSGVALLTYNRKHSQWGWKALLIQDRNGFGEPPGSAPSPFLENQHPNREPRIGCPVSGSKAGPSSD